MRETDNMQIEYEIGEIREVASRVVDYLMQQTNRIVLMEGEMGAGKTTLTKAICGIMGADEDEVNSPTFAIVNEYDSREGIIYHFDFYRLKNQMEAVDFGFLDYLATNRWCFMEWSEKVVDLLPEEIVTIRIETISESKRKITI